VTQRLFRAIVAWSVCGFAACKDISVPGGTPTAMEVVTAAPTSGVVNSTVSPGPSFVVKNESGQAMRASVTISVTAGGGTITGQPAQSNNGTTSIGTWTLGKTAAANTATVTVGNLTPITFSVTGTPGPPNKVIEVNAPATPRTGPANAVLTGPVVVAVADSFSNPIAGQVVNFSVLAGGGSLSGSLTATTDANGQATAPAWRLGKSAVPQTIRAISGALLPGDITATIQTNYLIVVRFYGAPMTASQQAIFTNAAQRIMGIITGDVADVQLSNTNISSCASGQGPLTEVADDLIIYAQAYAGDGPGGVLGRAGPCFDRRASAACANRCARIPVIGFMEFDQADLGTLETNGTLQDVIQHEMLHVVGIGSIWQTFSLENGVGSSNPQYTGAQGIAGCQAAGGTVACVSTVPLAGVGCPPSSGRECGAGTRDAHWHEATFGSELMTGFLSKGTNPLSALSVQSLQDLGYTVNAGDADAYTFAAGSIVAGSSLPTENPTLSWEVINIRPLYSIDASGNVTLVRNPIESNVTKP